MPRIYDSRSDPHDFCMDCWNNGDLDLEDVAFELFGNLGDGPDGRGNCFGHYSEHPDYELGDYYACEECGTELRSKDN